ncbi:MAG: alpha/beta hydrolase [Burkholderiales bacterium]|nr:alpha/beta hydrolase [Burkholderiales bacterium]
MYTPEPEGLTSPRAALAALPLWAERALLAPSRSAEVLVQGAAIHYLAWGDPAAPPVLLVHGTAAHAEWWRFVAPLLLPGYHVIALDLGGMGDSGHREDYSRETFVAELMAVAAHAAPGRAPVIVGHSLGGFITMAAGAQHGPALAGIVAIDAPLHPPGEEPERRWRGRANMPPMLFGSRDEAVSRFRLVPEQDCENGFIVDHIARHALTRTEQGWRWKVDPAIFGARARHSFVDDMLALRCPGAMFWGADSALFDDPLKAWLRRTFGHKFALVEIADAQHHVPLDQPVALAAALCAQLEAWRLQGRLGAAAG